METKHLQPVILAITFILSGAATQATLLNVSNPDNVLPGSGRTITVSSVALFAGLDDPYAMIDNLAADVDQDASFLFGQPAVDPSPNSLSISGFNSGFKTIRIFAAADPTREPTSILVRSSLSLVTTLNAGDYETLLGTFTFSQPPSSTIPLTAYPIVSPPPASARGYFDLNLTIPAPDGTRSLYMELADPVSGTRIYELQALVPEPSAAVLLGVGAALLWRRRS